jgi:hypothetical protein
MFNNAYYDQKRYDSSKSSDNKDKNILNWLKISYNNELMKSLVLESGDDNVVDDNVSND